ncbi:MAG: hypothetical protein H7240_12315 [Glaciimonas sp.]|nr:hypothetical protein [Glaciimonas sp.]
MKYCYLRYLYIAVFSSLVFVATAIHADADNVVVESLRPNMAMTGGNHRIDSTQGQFTYLVTVHNTNLKKQILRGRNFIAIDSRGVRHPVGFDGSRFDQKAA